MSLLLLILVLCSVPWLLAVPAFEFVFCALILGSLLWFFAASVFLRVGLDFTSAPTSTAMAIASILIVAILAYRRFGTGRVLIAVPESPPSSDSFADRLWAFSPIGMFILVFSLSFAFCLLWPDFIGMGERLRDYALLASTMDSPVVPREPWMDGATLNYYVFWYRFGHTISTLLGIETWETYHVMAAFALSFYSAVVYEIVRVIFKGGIALAAFGAIVVPFGSNVAGLVLWYTKDSSWWGPSRVVKGAINEFPAWSFILGDLHPHFLNLAALPFALLLLYRTISSTGSFEIKVVNIIGLVAGTTLFLFASNAWEVPMWLGTVTVLAALSCYNWWPDFERVLTTFKSGRSWFEIVKAATCLGFLVTAVSVALVESDPSAPTSSPVARMLLVAVGIGFFWAFFPFKSEARSLVARSIKIPRMAETMIFWVLVLASLKLSSSHIVPEGGKPAFVRSPIEVTTTAEIFTHWGFQLTVLAIAALVLLGARKVTLFAVAGLIIGIAYDKAALFLVALLAIFAAEALYAARDGGRPSAPLAGIFGRTVVLAGISLVLLPEFVFLDDPYGGENERMNTIFKIYTTAWGLLSLGALWAAKEAFGRVSLSMEWERESRLIAGVGAGLVSFILVLPFFYHTIGLRKNQPSDSGPAIEGLSEVNRKFPGSAAIIRKLRDLPRGSVLEAQGKAYDYTTFVSTLAGQPSYLGWSNHVNLLTRKYSEVTAREQKTEAIYKEQECSRRRSLVQEAGISYVVVGKLEEARYPGIQKSDFSCFTGIAQEEEYSLYSLSGEPST